MSALAQPTKRARDSYTFAREERSPSGRRSWGDAETDLLRTECRNGRTYSEIGALLGRSKASVQVRAGRLGFSNERPLGGHRPLRPALSPVHARALDIGTAAELIVCADIILSGRKAFMSAAGYAYDLVAEVDGALLRVGVKGCLSPTLRPASEGSRECYQFGIHRSTKNRTNRSGRYTTADCDLFALVALDTKDVIYIPPNKGGFVTSFHVDPKSSPIPLPSRNGTTRKHWSQFGLETALLALKGRS